MHYFLQPFTEDTAIISILQRRKLRLRGVICPGLHSGRAGILSVSCCRAKHCFQAHEHILSRRQAASGPAERPTIYQHVTKSSYLLFPSPDFSD